jgi:hypothetical protein
VQPFGVRCYALLMLQLYLLFLCGSWIQDLASFGRKACLLACGVDVELIILSTLTLEITYQLDLWIICMLWMSNVGVYHCNLGASFLFSCRFGPYVCHVSGLFRMCANG